MLEEYTQSRRDAEQAEYEERYREWVDSQPPEERAELNRLGLLEPESNICQINGKWRSVESMTFLAEPEQPEQASKLETDLLGRVLLELAGQKKPEIMIDAILSQLGLYSLDGLTCEDLGRKHGVSKQRFSIIRTAVTDQFGLPPAPGGRTDEQRK